MDAETAERGDGSVHIPVLSAQVAAAFGCIPERARTSYVVDATVGLGGHTELLLATYPWLNILGVDQDPEALERARTRLERFGSRVRLCRGRFSELARVMRQQQIGMPIGMLFDIGVSSMQLDVAERGFSFQHDGPLDMRMDPSRDRPASDIVNQWDESDLADLFFHEGGEKQSRKIARALVEARARAPFMRTAPLADLVARALGGGGGRIHPATRVFQALRRAVNEEGEELLAALHTADHCLADGGVLAVISFHSGEDGEVKRFLNAAARDGRFKLTPRKPLEADQAECRANPRARSAKLRVAERVRSEVRGETEIEGGECE
ncbi:MAG: 16S rRNA (cytosine(1402)-N(4))-methyltransferase RsmH [Planctomycetes bacterium]|nr:16S rRNA (cytosine(1402)-N(4))-methyltransferase RsmH [Planctomycetota bacterium]